MSGPAYRRRKSKTANCQVQLISAGGLTGQITQLNTQSCVRSDLTVWDSPVAETFRNSSWPATKSALDTSKQRSNKLDRVSLDFFTACGGA